MLSAIVARVVLAGVILTPGAVTPSTPPDTKPAQPAWSNVVELPNFKVDVDPKSIRMVVRNNGFEMLSTMKMDFGVPIQVPGKTKVGAYYVNEVVVKCKDDSFDIEKSTVYSVDGEVLASGVGVATIKNPKSAKSFITVWLHMSCNQFKGKHPPMVI